ncbi:hypothetical protein Sste5346_003202 [Sporothrix stenoceras]|uniref:C3H1-type domain-containing protein n=1 Tax=Sporothrix stenoceras TaxID=5173 RepID=A0ABR3ZDN5_9PEZI
MSRTSSTTSSLVNNSAPSQQSQPAQPAQLTQQAQSALDMGASYGNYFAYCLDRGNGLYTRLVPADLLPPTAGFIALQNDTRGMIVLPDPSTQSSPTMVPAAVNNHLVQGYAARQAQQDFGRLASKQAPPHSTTAPLAQRHGLPVNNNAKKHKVYCDKWVHEGICAFTQQGCKFKHEMPHDRATQRSVGLFQGYPNWYKKLQAQEEHHHHQQEQQQQPPFQMHGAATHVPTPAMAPLALPGPHATDAGSAQLQSLPKGLPYPIHAPSRVSTPPPPTPTLQPQSGAYQPFFSPFGSPTSNQPRTGMTAASANTTSDGHWRFNALNAASWRTPLTTNAATDGSRTTTSSTSQLTDNFARSLTLDGVTNAYQLQQPEQASAPTATANPPMSGLTGTTDFSSFGYGLGGFGSNYGLGRQLNSLEESSTNSSFGPIGPPAATANFVPSGVTSPTTALFQYRATQELSQIPQHEGRSNSWPEEEGGHLATTGW